MNSADRIRDLINRGGKTRADAAAVRKRSMLESLRERKISDDYLKQMPRRWRSGDVYSPHDLSPNEMSKWRKVRPPEVDVIDMLGINPKDHYRVSVAGQLAAKSCGTTLMQPCRTSPSSLST